MIKTISRRTALSLLGAGAASLAAPAVIRVRAQGLEKVRYQPGWLPQAEQGGFYQAIASGIYKEHGLDVEILRGGPQIDVNAPFLAGRTEFIESNSYSVLNYLREKLPGVAVAAIMQKDPRVLLSHPGVGNDSLAALKGKPILVATGGRQTYWLWLKAKYGFDDAQVRPYTFSMAPFLVDKTLSQQGLLTSEPFDMRKAGVDPVIHLLADNGFDNYNSIIMAAPKMIAEKPDLVKRFVEASAKGWVSYLGGDPAPGNALIKLGNPDMSDDKIAYSIAAMKQYGIIASGDTSTLGLGAMTEARWRRFYAGLVETGAQPAGLDLAAGYSLKFLSPKSVI